MMGGGGRREGGDGGEGILSGGSRFGIGDILLAGLWYRLGRLVRRE